MAQKGSPPDRGASMFTRARAASCSGCRRAKPPLKVWESVWYVYGGLSDNPKFIIEADETGAALGAMFRRFRKRADCEAELARVAAQPGGFAAATEYEKKRFQQDQQSAAQI